MTFLDLSCNCLSTLPEEIGQLENLQTLFLRHNFLAELPGSVSRLKKLQRLNIEHNAIEELPSFDEVIGLKELKARRNRIVVIRRSIHLPEITILDVSENRLSEIESFEGFSGVRDLFLGNNRLSALPGTVGLCPRLTKLYVQENQLRGLPAQLAECPQLQELDARGNRIEQIPAEIAGAPSLRKLLLCNNRLRDVPAEMGRMAKLVTLNLSMNRISALPDEWAGLASLKELQLTGNCLDQVPAVLAQLQALSSVHLGWNTIADLGGVLAGLPRLMLVHANGNPLTHIPDELCALKGLKEVFVGATQVAQVPDRLADIRGLVALDVSLTAVDALPAEMAKAQFLDRLDVGPLLYDRVPQELRDKKTLRLTLAGPAESRAPSFEVAQASMRGRRYTMEDASVVRLDYLGHADHAYFAIFDGHGGDETALAVAQDHPEDLAARLSALPANDEDLRTEELVLEHLRRSFVDVNERLKAERIKKSGTTGVVALLRKDRLYVAGIGDTRAVMCRAGVAQRVTVDHKPDMPAEERRIRSLGGFVSAEGRVFGLLAVSRAFGDLELRPYVTAVPDVHVLDLDRSSPSTLILACDGVWDMMSDQEACDLVLSESDPARAAAKLRDFAYSLGSMDNISVLVIHFFKN